MMRWFRQKSDQDSVETFVTPENRSLYWAFGLVAGSWLICLLVFAVISIVGPKMGLSPTQKAAATFAPFASETEFRSYLAAGQSTSGRGMDMLGGALMMKATAEMAPAEIPMPAGDNNAPTRVSGTNIQVFGVDEPDMVKTNGKELYVSGEQRYWIEPMVMERGIIAPDSMPAPRIPQALTQVLSVFPIEKIGKLAKIEAQGDLLLAGTTLIVLENNKVTGYDVSDPTEPTEAWSYTLADNRYITAARLVGESVILVTEMSVYPTTPCPLPLFTGSELAVKCTDIYHPIMPTPVNTTYTVLSLDPKTGKVKNQASVVGTSGQSVTYVSPEAAYLSVTQNQDWGALMAAFLTGEENTLIPKEVKERLTKVMALDISQSAKQVEVDTIINEYAMGMSDDERMTWETERNNQLSEFVDERKRELEKTSIAKINLADFGVTSGEVPGHPLNQFSMDEYEKNLRIATTVGGRGIGGGAKSGNDVYVLSPEMKVVGSVTDLGKEERIYAVRFMGDKGYVVTFKETDPLYSLDLSDPTKPVVTGELKIPGYSSYLHPLKDDLLVGIGKEEEQVKLSLFDVSNPANPTELDNYLIKDYWSEVLNNHHAFLQDSKHQIFFMPSEKGGYIFSYADNELKLVKAIEGTGIERAVTIDDYLYLVGRNRLKVVDESTWETVKTLEW